MSTKTTKDIIDLAYKVHQKIGKYLINLYDLSKKQKVKMLLHYLQIEQKKILRNIAEFRNDCSNEIINTRYQIVPEQDLNNWWDEIELNHEMRFREIIEIVTKFYECFRELYKIMTDISVSNGTKKAFNNLFQMENQCEKDLINSAIGLQMS